MRCTFTELTHFLQNLSFTEYGDSNELKFGKYVVRDFPNCEIFWKYFVVPFTKRMDGFPNQITQDFNVRQGIDPKIEDIANSHYSMFLNLVFAHLNLEAMMPSSIESIYTFLGSTCDLAEMTIGKFYCLLQKCQGKKSKVLQELTLDEIFIKAEEWYDKEYPNLYEYYLSKGKTKPIFLISTDNILVEYLKKDSQIRKDYEKHSQSIRQFRNIIVHDVKVARIIDDSSGNLLIPKPQVINNYRSWREVKDAAQNNEIISTDFVEQYQQATEDILKLERILNQIWETLINDFLKEFNSPHRDSLRRMYNIEFSSDSPTILECNINGCNGSINNVQPSGTYAGGTIEYRPFDDYIKQ
ncbi:MAG: hypothetical protein ABFD00_07165 [Chloroherpetonaceae bacterium]